ncbi:hypothetical protein [Fibrobacter sp. UWP2]|uniref:hypothetical protein n=1 Tax=Fibrobacter sp. UWP2 TaxID=1896216 RepID=UPI001160D8A3|nr:hypothetical protein [Fibrobacter sp. UWP2]
MAQLYPVELCESMVAKSRAALEKALEAQSYSIGGRSLNRASVDSCQKQLDLWLGRLATAKGLRRGKAFCVASIPH